MDGSSLSPNFDVGSLSDKEKQELQQFVASEGQRARIQNCRSINDPGLVESLPYRLLTTPAAVHALTDVCWKKCVTGKIAGAQLDRTEASCAQNCVDRFMDANFLVLKNLESIRGQQN